MTYHLQETTDSIIRESDGAVIPVDPSNRDYIDYQEWCKSNTPQQQPIPPFQP
jgi:hypothetical protein